MTAGRLGVAAFVALAACGYTGVARVQTSNGIVEGRTVEVIEGRIVQSDDGKAIWLPDGRVIPLTARGIRMYRERRGGTRGAKIGGVILGALGLATGIGIQASPRIEDDGDHSAIKLIGGCALLGALGGIMVGGSIGGAFTYWEQVSSPE